MNQQQKKWTQSQAQEWYADKKWIVGCNFIPSNAINQLEMWQEDDFDLSIIDKELALAESLGFNCVRVYLHDFLWLHNNSGFVNRIDAFLNLAQVHNIQSILVFFDACWNNHPYLGTQPEPIPGIHNSGWVQSPSAKILADKSQWGYLEEYVKTIITHFRNDERILFWDVYNEPGNEALISSSLELLEQSFLWAHEIRPSQPLSCGLWDYSPQYEEINSCIMKHSDIISFHCYDSPEKLCALIKSLVPYELPMICTEYLARTENCLFQNFLPILKRHNIGAINWGLVNGKTQTHIPWDYFSKMKNINPNELNRPWFHDIFNKDGSAYDKDECQFIKELILNN